MKPPKNKEPLLPGEVAHPSFGIVSISRVSGTHNFFGASGYYGQSVCITISEATIRRDGERHKFDTYPRRRLIEVQMTPLQFAMAISATAAEDTPCTLTWRDGAFTKPPEDHVTTRREALEEEFRAEMAKVADECQGILGQAKTLVDKPTVNKGDRQSFVTVAESLVAHIKSTVPFLVTRFTDVVQDMLAEVKVMDRPVTEPQPLKTLSVEDCCEQFEEYARGNERPDRVEVARAYNHCAQFLREHCKQHIPKDLQGRK